MLKAVKRGIRKAVRSMFKGVEEKLMSAMVHERCSLAQELKAHLDKRVMPLANDLARVVKKNLAGPGSFEEFKTHLDCRITQSANDIAQTVRNDLAGFYSEFSKIHRHIDFVQRDIMTVLQNRLHFAASHNLEVRTRFPVAFESADHLHPHGTAGDNTRCPRFIRTCETLFPRDKDLSFLDLGCSGGGMVLEAVLRGHLAIGLEGSDYSLKQQRAEWRLLGNNLFTCDISREFHIVDRLSSDDHEFDVITAWEVLEHIAERDLPEFFANVKRHLSPDGYFIASIAPRDDLNEQTGVNWHVTVKPREWWLETYHKNGFTAREGLLDPEDSVRGWRNPNRCYENDEPLPENPEERSFTLIAQKTK